MTSLPKYGVSSNLLMSLNRGSYMSAHVVLNLFDELGKRDKCEACRAFHIYFSQRV